MADRVGRSEGVRPGALRWGAILFTAAAALMIWPLWQPLLLAAWFAFFARPLVKLTSRITGGKRRAAAVLTVLLLLLILVPVGLFVASLVSAATDLLETLLRSKGARDAFATIVSGDSAPDHRFGLGEIAALAKQYGERAFDLAATIAGATVKGILGTSSSCWRPTPSSPTGPGSTPGSRTTSPSPRAASVAWRPPSARRAAGC